MTSHVIPNKIEKAKKNFFERTLLLATQYTQKTLTSQRIYCTQQNIDSNPVAHYIEVNRLRCDNIYAFFSFIYLFII